MTSKCGGTLLERLLLSACQERLVTSVFFFFLYLLSMFWLQSEESIDHGLK